LLQGHSTQALGKDLTHAALFTHFSVQPTGWYYTESNVTDNIPRLVTYRSEKWRFEEDGYQVVAEGIGERTREGCRRASSRLVSI
jgi:hypothetical protein